MIDKNPLLLVADDARLTGARTAVRHVAWCSSPARALPDYPPIRWRGWGRTAPNGVPEEGPGGKNPARAPRHPPHPRQRRSMKEKSGQAGLYDEIVDEEIAEVLEDAVAEVGGLIPPKAAPPPCRCGAGEFVRAPYPVRPRTSVRGENPHYRGHVPKVIASGFQLELCHFGRVEGFDLHVCVVTKRPIETGGDPAQWLPLARPRGPPQAAELASYSVV